ncbi:MAG TPA: endonuclease/exonuclease/phosphatase family protein [Anaerolineales bacterium]|nr:endonuclease/exonuclease/phosphatase family protein [Anaerolineales bacterium]
MNRESWLRLAVGTFVLLFFLQALRALFSMLFGILYDEIFAGSPTAWLPISLALVVVSLLAAFITPSRHGTLLPRAAAIVAALARIPITVNDAQARFWGSLLVVAAGGIFLVCLHQQERWRAWVAWLLALGADQLLRIVGQTYDLGLQSPFLSAQVILSTAVVGAAAATTWSDPDPAPVRGVPVWIPLSFGGMLFLQTSLLSVANASARWSGWSYEILAPLTLAVTLGALHPSLMRGLSPIRLRPGVLFVLLPVGLMLGAAGLGAISGIGLVLAYALVLMAWLRWASAAPEAGRLGAGVGWGMAFFLALSFLNAFTFTYPYTLPVLRGLGWAVYLIAGLAAAIPLLTVRVIPETSGRSLPVLAGAALAVILAVWACWPTPVDTDLDARAVRLATYNIHYGYDKDWGFNLEAQAEAIRRAGVDVIALQEVDTGRMTSFMVDDAYYLGRQLGMRVAYLPTLEHLTGIAILSRGDVESVESLYLSSFQEQTGILRVGLNTPEGELHAFGIWMGLSDEDTLRQIQEALAFIGDRSPASFGGDFNAEPGSPVYAAVLDGGFQDPFLALGLDPLPTSPAVDPHERIDFVFLRDLAPRRAIVSDSLASDHRMVVIEVDLTLPPLPGMAGTAE